MSKIKLSAVVLVFIILLPSIIKSDKEELHPRFWKLINKYQVLSNYFAKSRIKVISKNLSDNSIQKQEVLFEIGYTSETKNTFFEKSHIKMIDSENNINIISDGKTLYKYVLPLNQYMKIKVKNKSTLFENINELTLMFIFAPEKIFNDLPSSIKISDIKYKSINKPSYEIFKIYGKSDKEEFLLDLYIDKNSGLVNKWFLKTTQVNENIKMRNILIARYFDIRYNQENVSPALFEFTPPADAELVKEFDIAKYYESVKKKLDEFVGQTLQLPQIKPLNYDHASIQEKEFILLEFWATWCGICKKEIPLINKISKNYSDSLEIIAISFEKENDIKKYLEAHGKKIKYKVGKTEKSSLVEPYKMIVQYPTAFLLDKNKKLLKVWAGEKDKEEFLSTINEFIKGKK